jgi:hypothetical protein
MKKILVSTFFILVSLSFTKAANINITTNSNWSTSGISSADIVYVSGGATLTVDGTVSCAGLFLGQNSSAVASNGTLAFNSGRQLTVNGDVNFNSGSTGTIDMSAGGRLSLNNFSTLASTPVLIPGTGTIQINSPTSDFTLPSSVSFRNYFNLIINAASVRTVFVYSTGGPYTYSVGGDLTVNSGNLNIGNNTFNVTGTASFLSGTTTYTGQTSNEGNMILGGGTLAGAGIHVIAGSLTANSGTSSTISQSGNFTVNGATNISGTINWSSASGIKTFNSDLNISSTGSWVGSTRAFTFGGNIDIDGSYTGTGTYTLTGTNKVITGSGTTLNFGSVGISSPNACTLNTDNPITINTISGTGSLTLAASRTLICRGNLTVSVVNLSQNGSTVRYSGTSGAQAIRMTNYANLIIDRGAGSATMVAGTINISNNFTIVSGLLNLGTSSTRTINVTGNTVVSGSISGSSTTAGTYSFSGDFTLSSGASISLTGSGSLNFSFGGNIINNGNWTNTATASHALTLSGISKTISGNEVQAFNCNVNGTYTNNGTLTVRGNLAGSGTLTQGSGSVLTLLAAFTTSNFNGSTNSNTVNYSGTGAQTVKAEDYHHLTINNRSAAVTLASVGTISIKGNFTDNLTSNPYTVSGSTVNFNGATQSILGSGTNTAFNSLSISSGSTLLGENGTVSIAGSFTNNGTYNHNNGTLNFNAASGTQTISGTGITNLYDVIVTHSSGGGISLTSGTYNLFHSLNIASNTNTLALGTNLLTLKSTGLSNDATARIGNLTNITTFSGTINLERFIGGNTAWRQMGTCMSNKTLADWYNASTFPMSGFTGVPNVNGFISVYTYNETLSVGNFDNGWVAATNITNPISPDNGTLNGRGFNIYVGQTSNLTPMNNFTNTMSGSFIRGTRNITLTNQTPGGVFSSSNTGFHVLANPYPSQIDLSLGSWNAAIKGYYNLVNGSYVWNNGMTGIIPQGNAIMIFTDANNVSMSFTEAMKTSNGGSNTFMRTTHPKNNALELHINSNINTFEDQCAIFFNENGNDGYVNESDDVRKLNSPDNRVPRIATLTKEGVRTVQNDYIDLKHSFYLPVEVHTPYAGSYSINGKGIFADGKCLILLDKETGTEIDLTKDFNYTFQSNTKKTYENRFAIVNKSCGWNNSNNQNAIFRLNQNDENIELTLISDENVTGSLSVISINGQVVLNKSNCNLGNTEIINTQSLNKGIYIVKFVSDRVVYSEKIVIK